jgi:hypothetical protein
VIKMWYRIREWFSSQPNHRVDDPFADAMQLRRRQQAIRRTLAQVRAENTRTADL